MADNFSELIAWPLRTATHSVWTADKWLTNSHKACFRMRGHIFQTRCSPSERSTLSDMPSMNRKMLEQNRSDSQSKRRWSKCLVINVSSVANIRLTSLWSGCRGLWILLRASGIFPTFVLFVKGILELTFLMMNNSLHVAFVSTQNYKGKHVFLNFSKFCGGLYLQTPW